MKFKQHILKDSSSLHCQVDPPSCFRGNNKDRCTYRSPKFLNASCKFCPPTGKTQIPQTRLSVLFISFLTAVPEPMISENKPAGLVRNKLLLKAGGHYNILLLQHVLGKVLFPVNFTANFLCLCYSGLMNSREDFYNPN